MLQCSMYIVFCMDFLTYNTVVYLNFIQSLKILYTVTATLSQLRDTHAHTKHSQPVGPSERERSKENICQLKRENHHKERKTIVYVLRRGHFKLSMYTFSLHMTEHDSNCFWVTKKTLLRQFDLLNKRKINHTKV